MELRAKVNLYLTLKEGETKEKSINRLYKILDKIEEQNPQFIISELYESEIQQKHKEE